MLLITGVDQYMGFAIASHLAKYEQLRPHIRALCQDKTRCHGFIKSGIDVHQVDYNHPNQLSMAFRGVDYLVLAIGNENDRVENAKYICNFAAQSGVKSILCISHVAAVSNVHSSLKDYHLIEEDVIGSGCQYTILRLDFVQQYFHLWSNYAEKHRKLILPITEDVEFCPIDISDVCLSVESLLLDDEHKIKQPLDEQHDGQIYTLTGPELINGNHLMDCLVSSTGYQQFKYQFSRPMDLDYYLSRLSKDVWFDARLKREMSQIYHDDYQEEQYIDKVYSAPTEKQMQTCIEYFDWLQKTSGSVCVTHTSMLTRKPCKPISNFFERSAISFKPRV